MLKIIEELTFQWIATGLFFIHVAFSIKLITDETGKCEANEKTMWLNEKELNLF